jgi:hypothetical protein
VAAGVRGGRRRSLLEGGQPEVEAHRREASQTEVEAHRKEAGQTEVEARRRDVEEVVANEYREKVLARGR